MGYFMSVRGRLCLTCVIRYRGRQPFVLTSKSTAWSPKDCAVNGRKTCSGVVDRWAPCGVEETSPVRLSRAVNSLKYAYHDKYTQSFSTTAATTTRRWPCRVEPIMNKRQRFLARRHERMSNKPNVCVHFGFSFFFRLLLPRRKPRYSSTIVALHTILFVTFNSLLRTRKSCLNPCQRYRSAFGT